jgi:hypothetical protein
MSTPGGHRGIFWPLFGWLLLFSVFFSLYYSIKYLQMGKESFEHVYGERLGKLSLAMSAVTLLTLAGLITLFIVASSDHSSDDSNEAFSDVSTSSPPPVHPFIVSLPHSTPPHVVFTGSPPPIPPGATPISFSDRLPFIVTPPSSSPSH